MSAHTPGEWFSRQDDAGNWEVRDSNGNWIARVHFRNGPSEPEAAANAALVIAAPDLKRLLEEVLRAGNVNTRALKAAIKKASPGWVRDARAALAKAGVKP